MTPIELISMIRKSPKDLCLELMKNSPNPLMQNAFNLMNSGDMEGIERLARNACKSKGIDPDQLVNDLKTQFK